MPELPEVEATRRLLARFSGARLDAVDLIDPGALRRRWSTRPSDREAEAPARLAGAIGARLGGVDRHGKRIGARLGALSIGLHLGMTGSLIVGERPRFARIGFVWDGVPLWFDDARRFGGLRVVAGALDIGADLGPDALTADDLDRVARGVRPIKVALLDQAELAGVGNIHAVEALFRAGLDPRRPAGGLDGAERARLVAAVRAQLTEAIAAIDPAAMTWVRDGEGAEGFAVYGRVGQGCGRCGTRIEGATLGGRVTSWCPSCQG